MRLLLLGCLLLRLLLRWQLTRLLLPNEVVAQVAANEVAAVAHIRDDVRVDDEAAATDWRDSRSRLSFETKGTRLSVSSRSCFSFDY